MRQLAKESKKTFAWLLLPFVLLSLSSISPGLFASMLRTHAVGFLPSKILDSVAVVSAKEKDDGEFRGTLKLAFLNMQVPLAEWLEDDIRLYDLILFTRDLGHIVWVFGRNTSLLPAHVRREFLGRGIRLKSPAAATGDQLSSFLQRNSFDVVLHGISRFSLSVDDWELPVLLPDGAVASSRQTVHVVVAPPALEITPHETHPELAQHDSQTSLRESSSQQSHVEELALANACSRADFVLTSSDAQAARIKALSAARHPFHAAFLAIPSPSSRALRSPPSSNVASFSHRDGLAVITRSDVATDVKSLSHFLSASWPIISSRFPSLPLHVIDTAMAGPTPPPFALLRDDTEISSSHNIIWHGTVSAELLNQTLVLLFLSHVEGHVALSAWRHGLPLVLPPSGLEGCRLDQSGRDLSAIRVAFVAATVEDVAGHVTSLLSDSRLWSALSEAGRRHSVGLRSPQMKEALWRLKVAVGARNRGTGNMSRNRASQHSTHM
mmetsp:Transcript_20535/g.35292  ORF Transcript_20535/g.35292 Transcript_20535/m.35292 type:complete len:495 (+) Transcript_20535:59-1543(+)